MSSKEGQAVSYRSAGVDYDLLDAGKRKAIAAALGTSTLAEARGARAQDASRGEPAFVLQVGQVTLALVLECLGTKSSLARDYQELSGVDRFDWAGYDTVAAIVNDLCSVGALPLSVNAYFATGSAAWYEVEGRFESLVRGWEAACRDAGAVWGGGESPMLSGVIHDGEIDLAGSGVGTFPEGRGPLLGGELAEGDEIVFVASTGLHTNGASLARAAVAKAGDLSVTLPDGRSLGDALLAPSAIYASLIEALHGERIAITYLSHITGHGLRKLMRANRDFTYRVTDPGPVPALFEFLVRTLGLSPAVAYGTFNMGAGFAVYCRPGEAENVIRLAARTGHQAWPAGRVESGPRRVLLEPLGVVFDEQELRLR